MLLVKARHKDCSVTQLERHKIRDKCEDERYVVAFYI